MQILFVNLKSSIISDTLFILGGPCEMDLTGFPFDTVACHLSFESFNYNTDEVQVGASGKYRSTFDILSSFYNNMLNSFR